MDRAHYRWEKGAVILLKPKLVKRLAERIFPLMGVARTRGHSLRIWRYPYRIEMGNNICRTPCNRIVMCKVLVQLEAKIDF